MKSIYYENLASQKGNKTPLVVSENIFESIISECSGHYGFGGEDKNSFYVEVNHWNRCLDIINSGIQYGNYPYVLKRSFIKLDKNDRTILRHRNHRTT